MKRPPTSVRKFEAVNNVAEELAGGKSGKWHDQGPGGLTPTTWWTTMPFVSATDPMAHLVQIHHDSPSSVAATSLSARAKRSELTQLRREVRQLRQERELLKKAGLLCARIQPVVRYRWISARKAEGYQVARACRVMQVSTSGYYEWRANHERPSERDLDEAYLVNEIRAIHDHFDDSYGSPRLTNELAARGYCANHKRVERLVATYGLYATDARRRRVRTTVTDLWVPPLSDLVRRNFSVGAPGLRTCGDITYIGTDEGWLFLADVLDLGSRRIVGYAMDDHMRTELVAKALAMAVDTRGGDVDGMIFYHDRGSQYMSNDFRALCERNGIAQSVRRTGSCHDYAVAESLWATMKREFVHRYRFASRADAPRAFTGWINRYNAVRQHSSINGITPIE